MGCSPRGIKESDTTQRLSTAQHSEYKDVPGGSDGKESTCNAGYLDLIPGLERSPGGQHGRPLQYSCLENPMDRWAWRAAVHGVAKSRTRLNTRSEL